MIKKQYEQAARQFVGSRIEQVWYSEYQYPSLKPGWNTHPEFNSVDFSILLLTDRDILEVSAGEGAVLSHGLHIKRGSSPLQHAKTWHVTTRSAWRAYIGQVVEAARLHWAWQECGAERLQFPETLELDFGRGQRIFMTVRDARAEAADRPVVEQLTVFFGDQWARYYGVGPYAGISTKMMGPQHFPVRSRMPGAVDTPRTPFQAAYEARLEVLLGQQLEAIRLDPPSGDAYGGSLPARVASQSVILVTRNAAYRVRPGRPSAVPGLQLDFLDRVQTPPAALSDGYYGWEPYLGRGIWDVRIHWRWQKTGEGLVAFPRDLELFFSPDERLMLSLDAEAAPQQVHIDREGAATRRDGLGDPA